MSTIPPSLSQMLLGRAATPAAAQKPATDTAARFNDALSAQKAFFRQATGQAASVDQPAPKPAGVTPATFKATEIAQGTKPEDLRMLRPGSLLNIRI
ncbi:MAG: hypothetical protein LDL37_09360 [Asticcacaulis sp.]|uniref:hypothetical protein n=1 Tax=Asticcacaulis sp. TaxID=1872648 RepID=UPI0025C590A8|nr:hypothetical protein [Asticcacaulis sp.]MCA1935649.1 hypothetical protein [Asticcacaulis sp.]